MKYLLAFLVSLVSFDSSARWKPEYVKKVTSSELEISIKDNSKVCNGLLSVTVTGYDHWSEFAPFVYVEIIDKTRGSELASISERIPKSLSFCSAHRDLKNIKINWVQGVEGEFFQVRVLESIKP